MITLSHRSLKACAVPSLRAIVAGAYQAVINPTRVVRVWEKVLVFAFALVPEKFNVVVATPGPDSSSLPAERRPAAMKAT